MHKMKMLLLSTAVILAAARAALFAEDLACGQARGSSR